MDQNMEIEPKMRDLFDGAKGLVKMWDYWNIHGWRRRMGQSEVWSEYQRNVSKRSKSPIIDVGGKQIELEN